MRRVGLKLMAAVALAGCWTPASAGAARPEPASVAAYAMRDPCPSLGPGRVHCHVLELVPRASVALATVPSCRPPLARKGCFGLRPRDLRSAYHLPARARTAQTIAIVAAGDDRTSVRDLGVYDAEFALPECTPKNGCLTKLNGSGRRGPLPPASPQAAEESSLDLQVAHAVCPNCSLDLVEASSTSLAAFEEAEETAARLPGVTEISNSWGEAEPAQPPRAGAAFDHPGIVVTASAGDTGYDNWGSPEGERGAPEYPASSPDVIAVGGTTLTTGEHGEWLAEAPWEAQAGAGGSGCSRYFSAPVWQTSLPNWSAVGCQDRRAVADLAVDADPYTGVAIYDSSKNAEGIVPQWRRLGGTSVGAPLVAAAFALAGGAYGVAYPGQTLYEQAARRTHAVHDITSGSNGECVSMDCTVEEEAASCDATAICVAGPGYDGPTGIGSLNGVGALKPPRAQRGTGSAAVRLADG
jgi:subtilase family serine protease